MAQPVDSKNSAEVSVKINDKNGDTASAGGQEAELQVSSEKLKLSRDEKASTNSFGQWCNDHLANLKSNQSSSNFGRGQGDEQSLKEDFPKKCRQMKFGLLSLLQWVSFISLIVALICSLKVPIMKKQIVWDLPLWQWEVMCLVLICGHLVSGWAVHLIVFLIRSNFLLRKKVLYFVYGLRKAVQNTLWLCLVLIAWEIIFDEKVERESKSKVLRNVTKILFCLLVAASIWLLKTFLVKVLASSFHVKAYFEKIQKAFFNQFVMNKLLASDMTEAQPHPMPSRHRQTAFSEKWWNVVGCGQVRKRTTNDNMYKNLNRKNVTAWSMKKLINEFQSNDLSIFDKEKLDPEDAMDESRFKKRLGSKAQELTSSIFGNVAKTDPEYIYEDDLLSFMNAKDCSRFMGYFREAANGGGIFKQSFEEWMVNALSEREAVKLSLKDTNTAVDDLHYMLNVLVAIIVVIIWLIMFKVAISHFIVLTCSQLLLMVFIFGNTCKTTFEAIIFLFVMHPFDVGDRCEVDGVQMIVEEMNILTTVFLKVDNQKVIYPNSVLATKPISNFYRSPHMGDAVDFCIHISTPPGKITAMKQKIIEYIERKKDYWYPAPMVVTMDVEDMNKLKMAVWLRHRMNHQNMGERYTRRGLLVEEMIKVFRELDIEYRLLPLDMNVRHVPGTSSDQVLSNWRTCAR